MAFGIFISYRRADSAGDAGRIYDVLADRFPEAKVFMDIDTLRPGDAYEDVIDATVAACRVALVVIGPRWSSERLKDPGDLHRREISSSLEGGLLVVPVLVHRATLPDAEGLPEDIRDLVRRHAVELVDHRWRSDANELVDSLKTRAREVGDPVRPTGGERPQSRRRRNALVALGAVALAAVVAVVAVALTAGGGGGGGSGAARHVGQTPATTTSRAPTTTTSLAVTTSRAPIAAPPVGGIASPTGGWITLVSSLQQSTTSEDSALGTATSWRGRRDVAVLDSNRYSTLRAGYWILFLGPRDDQASAQADCNALRGSGQSTDCYVRQLVVR